VGEDGDAVEGAVVLRVVQPALEAVGTFTPDADANDVRRAANRDTHLRLKIPKRPNDTGRAADRNMQLSCKTPKGQPSPRL